MQKIHKPFRWIFLTAIFFSLGSYAQNYIEVHHTYYTLEYDTDLKSPLISWYIQTTEHATSTEKINRKSVSSFHKDPLIELQYQVASDAEYKRNGLYDKGHLSPYSAFNFDITAAKESMYYTNTAPQYSFFNEHPWEKLEQFILKKLAPEHDSIYVYTGCIYGENKMKDVPVPDFYWKVIVYNHGATSAAWLAKNEETTDTDYHHYSTTVEHLKELIKTNYPNLYLAF